jgi:Raf kinase inhibitor-like YbhB/YbcL family protein
MLFRLFSIFSFSPALLAALSLESAAGNRMVILEQNQSPQLSWEEVPKNTESFVLVLHENSFAYWIVYNIPVTTRYFPKGIKQSTVLADGSFQGMNDFDHIGYTGPAAPSRSHSYILTLYALDKRLALPPGQRFNNIQAEMLGHVLKSVSLTGLVPFNADRHPTAPNPILHTKPGDKR